MRIERGYELVESIPNGWQATANSLPTLKTNLGVKMRNVAINLNGIRLSRYLPKSLNASSNP